MDTLVQKFFTSRDDLLSSIQIDSYNSSIVNQIPKVIRQFNPIVSNIENKIVEVHIGCRRDADDNIIFDEDFIQIKPPVIQEIQENGEIKHRPLYPNEARLKNLTYNFELEANAVFKIISEGEDPEYRQGTVVLGKIPILLKSNMCILNNMPEPVLREMGECPFDKGGYFIVDGKEKVLVAQERQVENKLYINYHNASEEYQCSIRSSAENKFEPARVTKLFLDKNNLFNPGKIFPSARN